MPSHNNDADFNQSMGEHASSDAASMTDRERRKAEKGGIPAAAEAPAAPVSYAAEPSMLTSDEPQNTAALNDYDAAVDAFDQPMPQQDSAYAVQDDGYSPSSYGEGYGYIPATPITGADMYSRYNMGVASENPEVMAQVEANRKRRRRNRVIAAVLVVILCFAGAGTAGAYMYLNSINQNLAGTDEKEVEEVKEVLSPAPIGDEPFYMLLVGCDDREGVEGVRSDTTILARLDPKNNQVTLISIPRDTAIDIPGYGTQKFNAAYTFGGPSGTIEAASELCGVDISHYAEVHFDALIDIIDYIGGVDVDVPIPIDDVDAGGKLDAGYQHLNGEQAMIFARSRTYANGDFQRTTSQRLLIQAAAEKVRNMPATELPGLLMKISQSMVTDLTVQELLGLAMAFQDEPELVMYSCMIPSTTAMLDDVAYVVADVSLLQAMMTTIDQGGDPATVIPDDYTVTSSEEAKKQGIEVIINYGDENYAGGGPITTTTGTAESNYTGDANGGTGFSSYDSSYDNSYSGNGGYSDDSYDDDDSDDGDYSSADDDSDDGPSNRGGNDEE